MSDVNIDARAADQKIEQASEEASEKARQYAIRKGFLKPVSTRKQQR